MFHLKSMTFAAGIFMSNMAFSQGYINQLSIEGATVVFSTSVSKVGQNPSCVSAAAKELYAITLDDESGRGMYSLLVTAMASNQSISVTGATTCFGATDIQAVEKLNIAPTFNEPSSANASTGLFLYKGDGETKIGRIAAFDGESETYYYLHRERPRELSEYQVTSNFLIYYPEADCQGVGYLKTASRNSFNNIAYKEGLYFKSDRIKVAKTIKSYLDYDSGCKVKDWPFDIDVYGIVPGEHPLCGSYPCVLKED